MKKNIPYMCIKAGCLSLFICISISPAIAQKSRMLPNAAEVARVKALATALRTPAVVEKRDSAKILRTTGIAKECTLNISLPNDGKEQGNPLGGQGWRSKRENIKVDQPVVVYCT